MPLTPHKISPIPRKSLEISKTPIPLQGFDIHRDLQLLHQHGSHPPRLPANLTWQRHRQNSVRPKCGKPNAVNLPFGDGFRQPNQPIKMMILGIDSGFSTVISYLIQNTGCLKVPKNQTSPFSREHSATIAANRCTDGFPLVFAIDSSWIRFRKIVQQALSNWNRSRNEFVWVFNVKVMQVIYLTCNLSTLICIYSLHDIIIWY